MKSFKINNDNIAESATGAEHEKSAIYKKLKNIKLKYFGTRK